MEADVSVKCPVLVVEDDAPFRRSLENFLDRAGYAYHSCTNTRDALMLAEAVRPGILIVEYHLSDGNGVTLLRNLMRIVPEAERILISEYDFQAVAPKLADVPVGSFLKKPFDVVDLECALSGANSKGGKSSDTWEWKQELGSEGMPASLLK
ncbi:MAG: response regulator [Syntrophobacteraceae bacterium]|nr:response regulator [Syntrophobacteraceae bacterium]